MNLDQSGQALYERASDDGAAPWDELSAEGKAIWRDAQQLISDRLAKRLSDPLWYGLRPCPSCGAAIDNISGERVRGGWHNPGVPLDTYEAINLLEALKLVPDTGDWHGQLRLRCAAVLKRYGDGNQMPNATAAQMAEATIGRARGAQARA